jgi:DNA-binding transcriptional MerR regulator
MGFQQASLDFFNTPPEEKKPVAKEAVPEKENGLQNKPEPAAEKIDEKPAREQQPPEPIPEQFQEPEPIIIEPGKSSLSPEQEPQPESSEVDIPGFSPNVEPLVVDEEIREMDFVVKEKKVPAFNPGKKSTRGRMKLSEMDVMVDLVDVPADEVLFQKRYYNIGAVSDMFKVNISLIRFWENEFDILKPKKNGKGDRLFRPEDIKNLQLIYHLLREKKYTIDGAKDFLKKNKKAEDSFAVIDSLKKIKSFLLELKSNL